MRIMIVDDEPKVRRHLRAMIEKADAGYEIVAEAADGDQALALLPSCRPDIVITDIRMPRLGGLELLAAIQQRGYTVGRIILSGYDDFIYAQQAMRQSVQNYLLKPVSLQDLLTALERAGSEMEQARMLQHQLNKGEIACRERWLANLLHGRTIETAAKAALNCGLNISANQYTLYLLDAPRSDEDDEPVDWSDSWSRLQTPTCVLTALDRTRLACLVLEKHHAQSRAQEWHKWLAAYTHKAVVVYTEPVATLSAVRAQYLQGCKLLGSRWLLQGSSILSTAQWPQNEGASAWNNLKNWDRSALDNAIERSDMHEITHQVNSFFALLGEVGSAPETVQYFFVEDVLHSMRAVLRLGGDAYEVLGEPLNIDDMFKHMGFDELCAWYAALCQRIAQYRARIRVSRPKHVSERIIALFEEDCATNHSLQSLAADFYMSPAYLGQVFKRETGNTLHACLTEIRVAKSRALLLSTTLPVYEVAERVGYPNLRNYFTAFKKYTGCTPGQYREGASPS